MGSFSYQFGLNPPIDYPRMLIADTQQYAPNSSTPAYIFADQEIQAMTLIVQNVFQSSMLFDPPMSAQISQPPVPYLRIAAYLLRAAAANPAKLAGISALLDLKLSMDKSADALNALADKWLDMDDNTGAFYIIEQVNDPASFRDRFWKEIQRQVYL
jgi:hypothetical protein